MDFFTADTILDRLSNFVGLIFTNSFDHAVESGFSRIGNIGEDSVF